MTYNSQYTGAEHDTYVSKTALVDLIYPVGSIYMSVNAVSPATLFGGTWEAIQDKFLLCSGSTYASGSTGGEATHTLTVAEMPSHRHIASHVNTTICGVSNSTATWPAMLSKGINDTSGYNNYSLYEGGGQSHNNMPPYLTVNVWKRTA